MQRTADDVAAMEAENQALRADNKNLYLRVERLTVERDCARAEAEKWTREARLQMARAVEVDTLLNQTSRGLIAGLSKIADAARDAQAVEAAKMLTRDLVPRGHPTDLDKLRPRAPFPRFLTREDDARIPSAPYGSGANG